jgi:putative transposase
VEEYLGDGAKERQDEWTASIAVGSKPFIENVKALLDFRAKGREVRKGGGARYQLREGAAQYKALFRAKKSNIDLENTYIWDVKIE